MQIAVFNGLLTYLRRQQWPAATPVCRGLPRHAAAAAGRPGPHLPAPRRDHPAVVRGGRGRLSVLALRAVPEGCPGRDPAPARVVDAVPQR
ncbi:hypothetical protein G6F32_016672 [Rhizopus arrhizus]|nr:hypothetical protein G6F32_016672 [Rhizopus arrhizus]